MDLLLILCAISLSHSGGLSDSDRVEDAEADTPAPLRCIFGLKPCKDGSECVLHINICDGEEDCRDGSDEEDCMVRCETGQFQCAHGKKCIDMKEVCDGVAQCQDRSDEVDCWKPTASCALRCDNKTRCVPESFLCDGEKDCLDGTDEASCADEVCSSTEFRCTSGQCVSESLRCDGHADCPDRSDEKGCAKSPECPTQHHCPHSHECLLEEWICDGEEDCKDGTDEKNCEVTQVKCGEFQWPCTSKTECVPTSWKCDRVTDCKDGSDETGCGDVKCPSHQFQCGTGECLDPSMVCNTMTNCPDGSDEGGSCLSSNCSNVNGSRCAQDCYRTPQGTRCTCKAGFSLQLDGMSCADIDECEAIPPVCSHTCLNTQGSHECLCPLGYLLEPDGHHCKITGEPLLLASVQSELMLFNLRRATLDILTSGKKVVLSLDYDWKDQIVFWVGQDAESIKWISFDQKQMGTIFKGIKSDCIAVDWVGRNLYWTDGVGGQILATGLRTPATKPWSYTVVLDEDLEQPHSLVLLPQEGLMFWSEIGSEPQIERAGMDGSDRKVVVSQSISWPASLSVDSLAGRIYWTDEKLKCIGSATLDGGDLKILQLMETSSPFAVIVFNNEIYWSDTKSRTVQRAHKNTGKGRKVLLKQLGQPFDLKVVHETVQPNTSNPCTKLGCSHLCVLAPGPKGVCRCPSSLLLDEERITCITPADSSFLLLLSPTAVTQIYMRSMHSVVGLKEWPEHRALPLPNMNEATALDLVLRDQMLYVADAGQASVRLFKLKEALVPQGQAIRMEGETLMALALDWITLNLYWSGSKRPGILVTSPGGTHTAVLLHEAVERPGSIAVHPPTGRLCFTDLGEPARKALSRVECAFMDGHNQTSVWKRAGTPTSLTFLNEGTKLYWADIDTGVIASIGVDGSGYKEYKTEDGSLQSFAYGDNLLIWATLNAGTTKVWYGDGLKSKTLWFEVKTDVVSLKAYSKASQKGANECSNQNGGCSHLCLAFPGGRTCRCDQDHRPVDITDCVPDPICPPHTKPCRDGRMCLPHSKFCDGHPDCLDQSDEDCINDKAKAATKPQDTKSPDPVSEAPGLATMPSNNRSDILVQNLDAQPCDDQLCHEHGRCLMQNGETTCECLLEYSGEFCQDGIAESLRIPLSYGAVALITVIVVIGIVLAVRRKKGAQRSASAAARDTTLMDMEKQSSAQSVRKETCDPMEDLVSPVD
ncbi:hypothetical protein AAFF_G00009560 [Aldrovandia affinis]|uniref:EGF-like domain-containing protein n=1 Tax=Aldrovandia affinis TaxID=143900 RepID=A0AAD7S7G4_9TELE|nr:hypothetical protein AAFF_G00009560 [Aldrovandia affinis]